LTIAARDVSDNVSVDYTGTKSLTFSGANPSTNPVRQPLVTNSTGDTVAFGIPTPITFTNGIATVTGGANGQLRLFKVENAIISVTDGTVSSSGTDRLTVAVVPGALGQFSWTLASPQVNGVNFTGTNALVAQDDFGNAIPTFNASTDNVTITTNLPGSPAALTGLGSLANNVLNRSTDFVAASESDGTGMRYTDLPGQGPSRRHRRSVSKTGVSTSITIKHTPDAQRHHACGGQPHETLAVAMTGTNFVPGVTTADFGPNISIDTVIVNLQRS
jgi:hypothetical protein